MAKYTPRLSVELTEETYTRLLKLIPWGLKKYLIELLCSALCDAVERTGNDALAAILRRNAYITIHVKGETNGLRDN